MVETGSVGKWLFARDKIEPSLHTMMAPVGGGKK